MDTVIILSPEEFDTLRKQLKEVNEKTEIEFRLFVAKDVYDELLNQIGNPEKHT